MAKIGIELPMILGSPGIFLGMKGEKERIREILLEVCQKEKTVPSFLSKAKIDGEEGILVFYEVPEERMESIRRRVEGRAKELGVIVFPINTLKTDDRYMPEESISVSLLGEKVMIIPMRRVQTHAVAAVKMFGTRIKPVAKKIGEEEGEMIARFELSGIRITRREDAVKAIKSLIKVLECLGEVPRTKSSLEASEITIYLEPKSPGEMTASRLYGVIKGFFSAKGLRVWEEVGEGGPILTIETPEGSLKVRVKGSLKRFST